MGDFWQRAFVYPLYLFLIALLVWVTAGALPAALFFGIGMSLRLSPICATLLPSDRWLSDPDTRQCRMAPACGWMSFRNSTS